MRCSFRLILLLLLMAVVPVRGAIGASMVLCGPGHSGETAPLGSDATQSHHGNHGPHAPAAEQAASPDADDDAAKASAHDHAAKGSTTHHGTSMCSLCAGCCAGGSLFVSAALSLPVVEQRDGPFPPVQVRFERRAPDGLERPPHTFLA